MKNIRFFFSENFPFLVVKLSIYLNRCVFIMSTRPFLARLYEGEGRAIAVPTSSVLKLYLPNLWMILMLAIGLKFYDVPSKPT